MLGIRSRTQVTEEVLEAAKETFKNEPGPVDDAAKLLADMVALGDHPSITSRLVHHMITVAARRPDQVPSILVPTFGGRCRNFGTRAMLFPRASFTSHSQSTSA